MEQLVQFVMNNFVLVVIVVGIIYSLFFRKSPLEKRGRMPDFGGGQQQQQRPPGSPPQRGVPMRTPTARQEPRSAPQVRSAPPPAPEVRRPSPQPAEASEDAYAPPASFESTPVRDSASARTDAPTAAASAPAIGQPTRDELARAIVWAEILGPPRAKRPYRGVNR